MIFGGSPPYNVVNSFVGFAVTPAIVTASGGRFTVSLTTQAGCSTNAPVTITDSAGRTITVTLNNVEGTATAPPTPVSLFPADFALSCSSGAAAGSCDPSLTASGGTGTYSFGTTHPRVTVLVLTGTGDSAWAETRRGVAYPTTGVISVTDGITTDTSTFTMTDTVAPVGPDSNCP